MENGMQDQIKAFVRGELGCGCPDEVFLDINVIRQPDEFAGLPADYTVTIGGRLFVVLCTPDHWREVLVHLDQIVQNGRRARDRNGFNRCRLVVPATDHAAARSALQPRFAALGCVDDRIHLHVVTPAAVPDIGLCRASARGHQLPR